MFGIGLDLTIALGLMVIGVIVFFLSQMSILPKKSIPYVAIALAGVFGFTLFRRWRQGKIKEEIKALEKTRDEVEETLKEVKEHTQASEEELNRVEAEFEQAKAAQAKEALLIQERAEEKKKEIEELSTLEAFERFDAAFGGG